MAGGLESTIRNAAAKITKYVEDAGELRVETRYSLIAPGASATLNIEPNAEVDYKSYNLVALTVTKMDGDCQAVIPVRETEPNSGRLEPDAALLELHERNVKAAIEYRARVLNALVGALPLHMT
jgi:hypothetical protein